MRRRAALRVLLGLPALACAASIAEVLLRRHSTQIDQSS